MSGVTKPKPIKVYGRTHYACTRCKLAKIKCSGEKPSCSNCVSLKKSLQCIYPTKDRKVVIMESDLNNILQKLDDLQNPLKQTLFNSNEEHLPYGQDTQLNIYQHLDQSPQALQGPYDPQSIHGFIHGPTTYGPQNPQSFESNLKVQNHILPNQQLPQKFPVSNQLPPQNQSPISNQIISQANYIANSNGNLSANGPFNTFTRYDTNELPMSNDSQVPYPHIPISSPLGQLNSTPNLANYQSNLSLLNTLDCDPFADFQNFQLQSTLFNICIQKLPEKACVLELITKIYTTYSKEFYILGWDDLLANIDYIYSIVDDPSSIKQDSLGNIHSIFCHIFILLAFGYQLDHQPHEKYPPDFKYPGIDYYLLAEYLFHLTNEHITVMHIQCALLLGLYAANLSRYNTVYNFFGVAIRSAVSLNLHRKRYFPNPIDHDNLVFQEISKRIWWSVFVIEIIWATKTVHFQYTDTDVDLPTENLHLLENDPFDSQILEDNVHLTKYIAKFIRLIYGPNIRTFSLNYINTNQFNQKLLINNIIQSFQDLIVNVETPVLNQHRNRQYIGGPGARTSANLILRYHQSLILIIKPMLPLLYETSLLPVIKKNSDMIKTMITKGLYSACATIEIISKLNSTNYIFLLGFWDSQHLFCAILLLVISKIENLYFPSLDKGIALLKFMADNQNINARNCFNKLTKIQETLRANGVELDLSASKLNFPFEKVNNPHIHSILPYLPDEFMDGLEPLPENLNVAKAEDYDEETRVKLASLVNQIQQFDY